MTTPKNKKGKISEKKAVSIKKGTKLKMHAEQINKITNYIFRPIQCHMSTALMQETLVPQTPPQEMPQEYKHIMLEKNEEIRSMKKECQALAHQISQSHNLKKKTQIIIASSMLQAAEMKRMERRKVDSSLGYFIDNFKTFIEGYGIKDLKTNIDKIEEDVKNLLEKMSDRQYDQCERDCFVGSYSFKKKELEELKYEHQCKQDEVYWYRQRLKLAENEKRSRYCQEGWPIIYQKYQTLELLGSGGFAEVYKCFDLESNQIVAVKRVKFANLSQQNYIKTFEHIERQISIHSKLDHPNIIKLKSILELDKQKKIAIFQLEHCSGPQLSTYLKKYRRIQQNQAKLIIKQLLCALKYLNSQKERIIHYDLKPSNIMFHEGVVKLLDFGLCKTIKDGDDTNIELTSQGVGTYWYLPPQSFQSQDPKISPKVDIWSLGVIFYEMLYGVKPFGDGIPQNQIYAKGIILQAKKVEFPSNTNQLFVSSRAKMFIQSCLKYDQNERLNPFQAYNHPYIKD